MAEPKDPHDLPETEAAPKKKAAPRKRAPKKTASAAANGAAAPAPAEAPAEAGVAGERTAAAAPPPPVEAAPSEAAPAEVAPAEVAPAEVAPAEVAASAVPPAAPDAFEDAGTDPGARPAPPPPPPEHPFARDESSGAGFPAWFPVVLVAIAFLWAIVVKCGGEEDEEAPDVAADAAPAPDVAQAASDSPVPAAPAIVPPIATPPAAPVAMRPVPDYAGPALDPRGSPGETPAEISARQAEAAFQSGDLTGAEGHVNVAMAQSPGSARYERLKARVLFAAKRPQEALDLLDQAVKHDPRNPEVYRQRATVHLALGHDGHADRDMRAADRLANGTAPTTPP
jgi:tetratricopeptide (TPR) repeat protein